MAQQVVEELDRNGKNSWTNASLLDGVLGQLRQHGIEAGDGAGQFRVSRLAALLQAFKAQQPVAHAVRELYRAADLEKLPPERLVRIDLELAVD